MEQYIVQQIQNGSGDAWEVYQTGFPKFGPNFKATFSHGCHAKASAEHYAEFLNSEIQPKPTKKRTMDFYLFRFHLKAVRDRMLMLTSAIFAEGSQSDSVQRLVKNDFRDALKIAGEYFFGEDHDQEIELG